jgi:23S rRNA pseudouridine1911/1915/1917 synthase
VTSEPQENAKRAELKIIAIKNTSPGRWKVTINLLTGRYHQIRAQLSYHGMPIVGDGKYGSSSQGNILLHHTVLQFPHPTKNETVTVTSKAHF